MVSCFRCIKFQNTGKKHKITVCIERRERNKNRWCALDYVYETKNGENITCKHRKQDYRRAKTKMKEKFSSGTNIYMKPSKS